MSSKRSILLTIDNEHWYVEGRDESIVLEIDACHSIEVYNDKTEITIKEGTPLHSELTKIIDKIT